MKKDLQETFDNLNGLHKQVSQGNLMDYPKTNIQYYLQTP